MNSVIRFLIILFSQNVTVSPMIFYSIVTDIDSDEIITDDFDPYEIIEDF